MQKFILDLVVCRTSEPHLGYVLLQLTDPRQPLPPMQAGQFVEVRVDGSSATFLRRPISINFVDRQQNQLWLLVHAVGAGTRALAKLKEGDTLNVILPLGRGFTLPSSSTEGSTERFLLVGGGVGTAPLLYLGHELLALGHQPVFLLGARSAQDLLQLDDFRRLGEVQLTTEDGSEGEKGFVTNHSLLQKERFTSIATCGPTPMMKAVAAYARKADVECEVSLENLMACGLGACLCCVEKTVEGNLCVCKEGPVFNIRKLLWQV